MNQVETAISEDVSFLLERLMDQVPVNELVVQYNSSVSKIKREEYYPDENGLVVFHRKTVNEIHETGYSVAELNEFLDRFKDKIKRIAFQAWDDSIQKLCNIYESNSFSNWAEHSTILIVGEGGVISDIDVLGRGESDWVSDKMYPELDNWQRTKY